MNHNNINLTSEELTIILSLLREKEMFYLHQATQDIRAHGDACSMYMDKTRKLTAIIRKGELCIQNTD